MLRGFALEVVRRLREQGHVAYWAGGCVRDQLLGLEPHDFDVATDATPSQVQKLFRRSLAVGAQFGVIEVLGPAPGLHVQVATFRSDGTYHDGRHPDSVHFGSAEADAQRRDFTINGLFFDPLAEKVLDYVGGESDLRGRLVRAIGNPRERFQEDKLRLLRAVRFAARFSFTIEPGTWNAIREMASAVTQVSAERITDELRKLSALPRRAAAFAMLQETGLLAAVLGPWHAPTSSGFPVLGELGAEASFPLVLASLLLELHADGLERLLRDQPLANLAARLRLSNEERDATDWLLRERDVLRRAETLPASHLKPLLAHPLHQALLDGLAARLRVAGENMKPVEYCRELLRRLSPEDLNPPPLVTGDDLLRAGYLAGPHFRDWLGRLRAEQLDGTIRNREEGLSHVRQWALETKKEPT